MALLDGFLEIVRSLSASAVAPKDMNEAIEREEIKGQDTIFWSRLAILAVLAGWASTLPFERSTSYLLALATFAAFGFLQRLLTRLKPRTKLIPAIFVLLDITILTYILIVPPPFYVDGWTPQINLRLPNFLFLTLYVVSVALSYAPWLVLWAGISAISAWTFGFCWIAHLPGTIISSSRKTLDSQMSAKSVIASFLDPATVSITIFYIQMAFLALVTVVLTVAVGRARRLVYRQVTAEIDRTNLSRYFSPNIVRQLSIDNASLGRSLVQPAAVLFADMVGFTRITEALSPRELIELLRLLHMKLGQVAFDHGGTIDKYVGDCIMVHFGTPEPRDDDAVQALSCAAAMLKAIEEWNVERRTGGLYDISVGVGVHYGEVVVGNIGHSQRLEYAVIGDTVNVASRLERMTRDLGASIVASDALIQAVRSRGVEPTSIVDGLRLDPIRNVEGRHQPIAVWYQPRQN